jgi:DNA repair protein RadC
MEDNKIGHRQRLKERFLESSSAFSDADKLELLLTYAIPQKDVRELAEKLISDFGSIEAVLEAKDISLITYPMVKSSTIALFKLIQSIKSDINNLPFSDTKFVKESQLNESLFPAPDFIYEKPHKHLNRESEFFANSLVKETIEILPTLPDSKSYEEIKSFVRTNLHFSAEESRKRYSSYIMNRMFPNNLSNLPLIRFAKLYKNQQALNDVVFYHFCKAEPLMVKIINEFFLQNIGKGSLERVFLKSKVKELFPNHLDKSVGKCVSAAVEAFRAANIGKNDTKTIFFNYRDTLLPSFAYILHAEFAEPGMFNFDLMLENNNIKSMLWYPERMIECLYELRNKGIISKVSEIDNMRQFTTKYTLNELVEKISNGELVI